LKRKPLSKKTRFDVFKRDGFVCQYCGAHPPAAILHVDHIRPVAGGGTNDIDNLVTACASCNGGKGARSLQDIPTSLADRAAEVQEREAQIRGFNEIMSAKRDRLDSEAWDVASVWCAHFGTDEIYTRYLQSIRMFIERLGLHEVIGAMEYSVTRVSYSQNPCFKYFCAVCWNKIRKMEGSQ
jgi:hypothetical protein